MTAEFDKLDSTIKQLEERYSRISEADVEELQRIYKRLQSTSTRDLSTLRDTLTAYKKMVIPGLINQQISRLKTVSAMIKSSKR